MAGGSPYEPAATLILVGSERPEAPGVSARSTVSWLVPGVNGIVE